MNSVALSADGRWALSGSEDKTLRLWEVASGRCVRTFEGHTSDVTSVALSADGRWALSGSEDKTLRLWEVASGRCVRTFEGHTWRVTSVALTADGRLGAVGKRGQDPPAVGSGQWSLRADLRGAYRRAVNSVALSADGRWALSGSRDNTLRLWEVASGRCVRTFEGNTNAVNFVRPDGRWPLGAVGKRRQYPPAVGSGQWSLHADFRVAQCKLWSQWQLAPMVDGCCREALTIPSGCGRWPVGSTALGW